MVKYNHLVARTLILYNAHEMSRVILRLIDEDYPITEAGNSAYTEQTISIALVLIH